jgi:hypothetical protein
MEVGVQENAEKTNMFKPRVQKARQNHDIQIASKSFETVVNL